MMTPTVLIVSGAYGRDYKSAKKAKADWEANLDFRIRNFDVQGTYTSSNDLARMEASKRPRWVNIRFDGDAKVCVIDLRTVTTSGRKRKAKPVDVVQPIAPKPFTVGAVLNFKLTNPTR